VRASAQTAARSSWRRAGLARLAADGLVKAGGKQRTDSTHVVAAVPALTVPELGLVYTSGQVAWDKDGNLYVQDWNVSGRIIKLARVK